MEMMKAHKYNVEHRLKYDNQERILYRHHFNYYPVKRPRPRKTSLEPNWYTENIYSNQSIDNSDGELGIGVARLGPQSAGAAGGHDINGNMSMAGLEDDGIFTIDGHFERRDNYPKSNSCCFGVNRMRDIDEMGDGLERDRWTERYPKIPKSYSFSTSRNMGIGFNMGKLYNRNSFEMPEFPGHHRRQAEGGRAIMRMCDREGCFNETCFSKDDKNSYNNNNVHNTHNNNACGNIHNNNNNNSIHSNIISEWNLRNRNNLRAGVGANYAPRSQYVMEEDFDLFDENEDDCVEDEDDEEDEEHGRDRDQDEIESDLNTFYAEDRHSIACGDYGGVTRELYGRPLGIGTGHVANLYRAERAKQLLHRRHDRATKFVNTEYTDDYRRSFEDFFNQNCCIDHNHREGRKAPSTPVKNKSMLEVKPPNRFDDTSSDSTDLELDDFNFDFEKYWEELEKPSPTSPSELEEHQHTGKSAMAAGGPGSTARIKKVKNVNLSRCYNNGTVIDIYHDDDPYHRDHYHYREGGGKTIKQHHGHRHRSGGASRCKGSRHKVYPADMDQRPAGCDEQSANGFTSTTARRPTGAKHLDVAGNAIGGNSNAISFLNNIFSIYKPNKYSPLNCHVEQNYLKNIPAKKMNIVASSATRPLGANAERQQATKGGSDPSSTKRPLTVHPAKPSVASVASAARRNASRPATTKDPQARFQIIPDKTGVKISPLYRLDAQDYRRARYKLKSTSRPLSFW